MTVNNLRYSKRGLALTESFEGKSNASYWDKIGRCWTIGYGATGPDIHEGMYWTDDQCVANLLFRMNIVGNRVDAFLQVKVSQNEFDAICDLCYNAGVGVLTQHTFGKLLNAGDFKGASAQIDEWDHAAGKVVAGLLRRREAETALFNEPDPAQT